MSLLELSLIYLMQHACHMIRYVQLHLMPFPELYHDLSHTLAFASNLYHVSIKLWYYVVLSLAFIRKWLIVLTDSIIDELITFTALFVLTFLSCHSICELLPSIFGNFFSLLEQFFDNVENDFLIKSLTHFYSFEVHFLFI